MENISSKLGLNIIDAIQEKQDLLDSASLDMETSFYMPDIIVFKLDDVLVDTTFSTITSLKNTYKYFTGKQLSDYSVTYKRHMGGYDNKFKLTHHLIQEYGFNFDFQDIVNKFQEYYWNDSQGLIDSENLLVDVNLLHNLSTKCKLVIVSDSPRIEVDFKLHKFSLHDYFYKIYSIDDLLKENTFISQIINQVDSDKIWYIGSTLDDMKTCISENILGFAICDTQDADIPRILSNNGAYAVLKSVNLIEQYFRNNIN